MATILVHVTQDHIDKGCKGASDNCPVALALLAVGIQHPSVTLGTIAGLSSGKQSVMRPMSRSVKRFIRGFDAGKPIQPFTFKLRF